MKPRFYKRKLNGAWWIRDRLTDRSLAESYRKEDIELLIKVLNRRNSKQPSITRQSPPRKCSRATCPIGDKWYQCPMAGHEHCGYDIDDD